MSFYNILDENTININAFLNKLNNRVNVNYDKDEYRDRLLAPVINNNRPLFHGNFQNEILDTLYQQTTFFKTYIQQLIYLFEYNYAIEDSWRNILDTDTNRSSHMTENFIVYLLPLLCALMKEEQFKLYIEHTDCFACDQGTYLRLFDYITCSYQCSYPIDEQKYNIPTTICQYPTNNTDTCILYFRKLGLYIHGSVVKCTGYLIKELWYKNELKCNLVYVPSIIAYYFTRKFLFSKITNQEVKLIRNTLITLHSKVKNDQNIQKKSEDAQNIRNELEEDRKFRCNLLGCLHNVFALQYHQKVENILLQAYDNNGKSNLANLLGLTKQDTPGDGMCFYWAVCQGLYENTQEEQVINLRTNALANINFEIFPFSNQDIYKYTIGHLSTSQQKEIKDSFNGDSFEDAKNKSLFYKYYVNLHRNNTTIYADKNMQKAVTIYLKNIAIILFTNAGGTNIAQVHYNGMEYNYVEFMENMPTKLIHIIYIHHKELHFSSYLPSVEYNKNIQYTPRTEKEFQQQCMLIKQLQACEYSYAQ
jgi:hypothetical protein